MNNNPTSRFVRGRGRGGGGQYRPYFYFRRNGKTIPAGANNNENVERGPAAKWRGRRRRGGGTGAGGFSNVAQNDFNNDSAIIDPNSSRFIRAGCFAIPEDSFNAIQSIAIEQVQQCPGWQLYFYKEKYDESSNVAKRIKAIEKHYANNAELYNIMAIGTKRYFHLDLNVVNKDADILATWPDLMTDLRLQPIRSLAIFSVAMFSLVAIALLDASLSLVACNRSKYTRSLVAQKIYARPINFGNTLSFSSISTEYVDCLWSLRGSVVAIGEVDATASWICYKCSRCTQEQALRQTGNIVSKPYSCKRSECHARKGFIEQRSSPYTRIRTMQLISLIEHTIDPDSKRFETLTVELRHDLVDCIRPGQDVVITGVLKMRPLSELERRNATTLAKGNTLQMYVKAMSITDATNIKQHFNDTDLEAIGAINAEQDSFKLLVHSLAPEVFGQELAKAGLLLALSGGVGTQLHDEPDINILLVGDPGTGKSHMLEMCSRLSEKGNLVVAKRAPGQTSIVTTSQGRAQCALNLGALTCSAKGHVVIDDIDRLASQQESLLQALQSQYLTVPFNGVYTTETTTTSIIAAANPTKGHYNSSKLLTENVRLSPSLSCCFHLVFVLADKPDKDSDTSLVEHVKKLHAGEKRSSAIANRYANKIKSNNSMISHELSDCDENENSSYNLVERLKLTLLEENELDLLPPILLKKFLVCARQSVTPFLNEAAAEALKKFYLNIRKDMASEKEAGIGACQLSGLIRLSQARARIDFANEVTKAHVRDVICIIEQSMSDTEVGDYIDLDHSTSRVSRSTSIKKFLTILRKQSNTMNRRIFEYEELKELANDAGISSDIAQIIDAINLQGFLLKKGSNMYEIIDM